MALSTLRPLYLSGHLPAIFFYYKACIISLLHSNLHLMKPLKKKTQLDLGFSLYLLPIVFTS